MTNLFNDRGLCRIAVICTDIIPNICKGNFIHTDDLTFNGTICEGYFPITKALAPVIFKDFNHQLIGFITDNELGDDDFYDYFPSAYDQLHQIAYAMHYGQPNIEDLVKQSMVPIDEAIATYDARYTEYETLRDQCTGVTLESMKTFQQQF